jgi:hypothetical protein
LCGACDRIAHRRLRLISRWPRANRFSRSTRGFSLAHHSLHTSALEPASVCKVGRRRLGGVVGASYHTRSALVRALRRARCWVVGVGEYPFLGKWNHIPTVDDSPIRHPSPYRSQRSCRPHLCGSCPACSRSVAVARSSTRTLRPTCIPPFLTPAFSCNLALLVARLAHQSPDPTRRWR